MAALTPSSGVQRESLGSLTLLIVPLTIGSTSDTYTISSSSAVVDYWCQSHNSTAVTAPTVSYAATTGIFTITSTTTYGQSSLFILIRG